MSTTSNPPAESRFHHFTTLLEHIGKVGAEKIVPFADNIGSLINGFVPGVGTAVAKVIKAVGQAQANAQSAGDSEGSGAQKLSHVLASVSADVAKTLGYCGRPSDTTAVTAVINQAVDAMKSIPVPALPPAATPAQAQQVQPPPTVPKT
jgi:hypothetical protein